MLLKIISVFLIFIAVLAMFGKLRVFLRVMDPRMKKRPLSSGGKCASCGAPRVGSGPCPCGK